MFVNRIGIHALLSPWIKKIIIKMDKNLHKLCTNCFKEPKRLCVPNRFYMEKCLNSILLSFLRVIYIIHPYVLVEHSISNLCALM